MLCNLYRAILLVLAISILGCASPDMKEHRKKLAYEYFDCIVDKSNNLDDGVSRIGDVANSAIFACIYYENAAVNPYQQFTQDTARNSLREGAFKIAIKTILSNRNVTDTNK